MRKENCLTIISIIFIMTLIDFVGHSQTLTYPIVGTGVTVCYDNSTTITCPTSPSVSFYGQFPGTLLPSYVDNGNYTITDLNTGLIWQSSPDLNGDNDGVIEKADKLTWAQIQTKVASLNSSNWGGHNDWRIPSMKELYSITNWNGTDPSGVTNNSTSGLLPFLDSTYFPFAWGQTSAGERLIDAQYVSSNVYNDLSYEGYTKYFGMNFADGRIKGYDNKMLDGITEKTFSFIAVRGNTSYGINDFVDNGDSTITDNATGLMWAKYDSQTGMNWQSALAWAQTKNNANYCGHNDWRLPNAKELQSILDYTRSPQSTQSAAIDPLFSISSITAPNGRTDWPYFWTSTTHYSYNGTSYSGAAAVYVCFGRAAGWTKFGTNSYYSYYDAHGAGAQRSDPKGGTNYGMSLGVDSLGNTVYAMGPQGDIIRINNYVRLVRDVDTVTGMNGQNTKDNPITVYPNPVSDVCTVLLNDDYSKVKIELFNSIGSKVKELEIINAAGTDINLNDLPNGIYFLTAATEKGISFTKKIIVTK
jgi:hypothetical protein